MNTLLVRFLAWFYHYFTGREIDSYNPDDFDDNNENDNNEKGLKK